MSNVLLMNSGGADSRALAKILQTGGFIVGSVYVDTRADNAVASKIAAQETATLYGCAFHDVITLDAGFGSTIMNENGYLMQTSHASSLMAIIGAWYARTRSVHEGANYTSVYLGLRGVVDVTFLDSLNAFQRAATIDYWRPEIVLPFMTVGGYPEVMTLSGLTPVELRSTVSCASTIPCGTCPKCVERKSSGIDL